MLPCDVQKELSVKSIYDYGMTFKENTFEFFPTYSVLPNSMVISYALAVIAQGKAKHIYLAGFDGYGEDDPRNNEMNELLKLYNSLDSAVPLTSITPTRYKINSRSVYEISYNSQ
jgi:4-hydroxy 2-oxovalerate aldolase